MEVIKVQAAETTCNTTAQAYSGQKLIRLYNNTAGAVLITRKDNGGNTLGTFTLVSNGAIACAKDAGDTLTANASILAVPIAFAN